jgi:hypothetical protein
MPIKPSPPPPEQQQVPYLPAGPQPLVFEKFQGIKTSTTRPGVPDEACFWMDGFFPIGIRDARTIPDVGPKLWTVPAGTTLSFFGFVNIGTSALMIAFVSDGSLWQVNTATAVAMQIAAPGTISNPSRLNCGLTQYGNQYIIIVANQTNGYFIWDGTTFYFPGDPFAGGTVPTGTSGTTVETYAGRVWVANGPLIQFSAPGSVTDFATSDGGGNFSSSDSFLRDRFVQLLQSNGFLYLIGDSSINYISGVQTSGTPPPTTTFTNQNADPEVGSPWPGTVGVFSRNIVLANAFGAHISYGAAVTKISEDLDGVYSTMPNFGGLIPSAAKAIVYGKKVWVLLLPIIDPITNQQVNKLFLWNTKLWFSTNQGVALSFIAAQEIDSVLTAYGTDGTNVYPLFQQPSANFTKTIQSRLWDTPIGLQNLKETGRLWGMAQYYGFDSPDLTVSIDNESGSVENTVLVGPSVMMWTNDLGQTMTWTNNLGQPMTWFAVGGAIQVFAPQAISQTGVLLGFTVSTQADDMALINLTMQPEIVGYRG